MVTMKHTINDGKLAILNLKKTPKIKMIIDESIDRAINLRKEFHGLVKKALLSLVSAFCSTNSTSGSMMLVVVSLFGFWAPGLKIPSLFAAVHSLKDWCHTKVSSSSWRDFIKYLMCSRSSGPCCL